LGEIPPCSVAPDALAYNFSLLSEIIFYLFAYLELVLQLFLLDQVRLLLLWKGFSLAENYVYLACNRFQCNIVVACVPIVQCTIECFVHWSEFFDVFISG